MGIAKQMDDGVLKDFIKAVQHNSIVASPAGWIADNEGRLNAKDNQLDKGWTDPGPFSDLKTQGAAWFLQETKIYENKTLDENINSSKLFGSEKKPVNRPMV